MKVLSIKQPWTYLIAAGIKDVENRPWKTNYRGRFLIHSPQKRDEETIYKMFVGGNYTNPGGKIICVGKSFDKFCNGIMVLSAIIGEVEIIDCIQDSKSDWAEPGCWHFVLRHPVLYEKPILNVKGKLNFWEYEEEKIKDNSLLHDRLCPNCNKIISFNSYFGAYICNTCHYKDDSYNIERIIKQSNKG